MGTGPNRHGGFNIIELMITVAIIGIVALIAIPNMNTLVENQRVRAAANDMATAVSLARSEAVRDSADRRILAREVDNDRDFANGWCVVNPGDDCDAANVIRVYELAGNVNVAVNNVNNDRMDFDRQGARRSDDSHRFTFRPPNCPGGQQRARQVEIRPSGRPMVTEVNC